MAESFSAPARSVEPRPALLYLPPNDLHGGYTFFKQSRGDLFGRNKKDLAYDKARQAAARLIQLRTRPFLARQRTSAMQAILARTAATPPTDGGGGSCFTRTVGSSHRSPMGAPAYRGVGHSECAASSGRCVLHTYSTRAPHG